MTDGITGLEHWQDQREARAGDAEHRAKLFRLIAQASHAAREQAHRSLDTAIRSTATHDDRDTHAGDVMAAYWLRMAMTAGGHP